ncbi:MULTISPECIES: hypothetical protein [unclassified Halomonas]|jgi:hypothetical protein|nr:MULTISPECIES: hypothetical protein [unclassified Halomonas]MDM7480541.1 hypothetical protein [Halomonas sp.]
MTPQTLSLALLGALAIAGGTALAWWGWQSLDAGLLLMGSRLC